jgi:phosphate transport system permease protein
VNKPHRRLNHALLVGSTALATLLLLASVVWLLLDVFVRGAPGLSLGFLLQSPSDGLVGGGIFPAIFGTAAMVMLMTLAGVPVGVATAIYLTEYARSDSRAALLIRIAVNNLAGVPSIVFGLFGLGFFVQVVGRGIDQVFFDSSKVYGQPALLWAALTMAVLTLPVVIVTVEEAMRAVPRELRQASLALGATRFQTILHVVLPQSAAGIMTGTILAVSRGAGEVAPILFTGAAYYLPQLPSDLHSQFMHLGYHVYVLSTQSPDVDAARPVLYATVATLLGLTFLLNFLVILMRGRLRRRHVNVG